MYIIYIPQSSPPLPQSNLKWKNKKQKRNQSAGEDVYVGADGNYFARDVGADETSVSRVASIRTSLSHGVRSKLGKKNQANDGTGDYQAPV
jgi:hypothetical protein